MEKRGLGPLSWETLLYTIFTIAFLLLMFNFVTGYRGGSALWEDLYAKEIANLINHAEPGTEVKLDVSRLSSLAVKNGKDVRDIIYINNVDNSVTVSIRNGAGTRYSFFNDVDIIEPRVEAVSGGAVVNRLIFSVREKAA